jgi:two-component system response regulator HydG
MIVACPGDCNCVTKDLDVIELIMKQTSGAIKRAAIQEEEIGNLRTRIEHSRGYSGLIGKDPKMQIIYKLIEDVAPTDATILIQGESGTGKELVARAIHSQSLRKNKPFVVINCSAYPATLLESELFGHEKGAFTGAIRQKFGRFEQAHGGTVFLDEIGEIPPSSQIKLLRVLQSQKFERLGGEQTLTVNVRVLAATNKNLLEQVKTGEFREDLFYRLNVIPIDLPSLRKRSNDIPLLARHFLSRFASEQGKSLQGFSSEAMRLLLDYSWPGNVRELENAIEHAAVLAKGRHIDVIDLPSQLRHAEINDNDRVPRTTILENEKKLLEEVLEDCGWNKKEAAIRLGISRSTLYGKLKKYRISKPTIH